MPRNAYFRERAKKMATRKERTHWKPPTLIDRNCFHCGKWFQVSQKEFDRGWGNYCSHAHGKAHRAFMNLKKESFKQLRAEAVVVPLQKKETPAEYYRTQPPKVLPSMTGLDFPEDYKLCN